MSPRAVLRCCTLLLIAAACLGPQRARADIYVSNFADYGLGTLRQAVADAAPGETIRFQPWVATIYLSNQIVINKNLTIIGNGAANLAIDGGHVTRIFEISAAVAISGLTITNGFGLVIDGGGILVDQPGAVTLSNCVFTRDFAEDAVGGAIENYGTLVAYGCIFTNNDSKYGGAIDASQGTMHLAGCLFAYNHAKGAGGGLYLQSGGSVLIENCTFVGNKATSLGYSFGGPGNGGAIASVGANVVVKSCTIWGNASAGPDDPCQTCGTGGGIYTSSGLTLLNTIIAGNLADQLGSDDIYVDSSPWTVNSLGYNFIGVGNAALGWVATDFVGDYRDLLVATLGPLQDNGGPTLTKAWLPGSLGIDNGSSGGLTTDQRGLPRPHNSGQGNPNGGDKSDIGAFEKQGPSITQQPQASVPLVAVGQNETFTSAATPDAGLYNPLTYVWLRDGVPVATNQNFTRTNMQLSDAGGYSVRVSDVTGDVTTSAVVVVTVGFSITTNVTGSGNILASPNQTVYTNTSVLTLTAAPAPGWWFASWSGAVAGTNNPVSVTMTSNKSVTANFGSFPAFVTFPASRTNGIGSTASFSATASATSYPSYQWQFNGTNVPGATSATYLRTNVQLSDAGNYTIIVSNPLGSVTSSPPAALVVIPCPNYSVGLPSTLVGNAGTPYTGTFTMSGGYPPYSFSLSSGTVPQGLSLSSPGGLSGTLTHEGVYSFGITGTDIYGCVGTTQIVFQVFPANTFYSSVGGLRIPPFGTGGSGVATQDIRVVNIPVSGVGTQVVKSVSVGLLAEHARDGDLRITLTPPGGPPTLLADQRGGDGSNFTYTTFRNYERTNIAGASAPFTGNFSPEGTLVYTNPNGTWQLQIEDKVAGSIGQLLSWWLTIQQAPQIQSNAWLWSVAASANGVSAIVDSALGTPHQTYAQYGNSIWVLKTGDGSLVTTYSLGMGAQLALAGMGANGDGALLLAAANGSVYRRRASDLAQIWGVDTRRLSCPQDTLSATPAVQLRRLSDAAFRAAYPDDLVFVTTAYVCSPGADSANCVWAMNGSSGSLVWRSDVTAGLSVGRGSGMVVDYLRNTMFSTADYNIPFGQAVVSALATTNGGLRWAVSSAIGGVQSRPLLANDWLYVGTKNGVLFKFNPTNGASVWGGGILLWNNGAFLTDDMAFDPVRKQVLVTASDGRLFAVADLGTVPAPTWVVNLNGALANTAAVVATNFDKIYVGARDGRVYQLNPANGQIESYATVQAGNSVVDLRLDSDDGGPALYRLSAMTAFTVVRGAIPWGLSGADKGVVTPVQADVHLVAGPATTTTTLGQPIPYTLQVSDSGPSLSSVTLWDTLPAGMGFQSANVSQGTFSISGNALTAELGLFPPGGSALVSLVVTSAVAGSFVHTAAIGGFYRDAVSGPADTLTDNGVTIIHNVSLASPAPPVLNIATVGSNVVLSWLTNATGYTLTSNTNLGSTSWAAVSPGPTVQGASFVVTNAASAKAVYYRLRKP